MPAFLSNATAAPEFEQVTQSEEEPQFASSQTSVSQFSAPTQSLTPAFYPSYLNLTIDGIGTLEVDMSRHDAKIIFNGKHVEGVTHNLKEGKDAKSVILLKDEMAVASFTILPEMFK